LLFSDPKTNKYSDHQTSTPVTTCEMSFRSASKQYEETHKIVHTNITSINVGKSGKDTEDHLSHMHNTSPLSRYTGLDEVDAKFMDYQSEKVESKIKGTFTTESRLKFEDYQSEKVDSDIKDTFTTENRLKFETEYECMEVFAEENEPKKVLSPEQEAVKSFLSSRRSSSDTRFNNKPLPRKLHHNGLTIGRFSGRGNSKSPSTQPDFNEMNGHISADNSPMRRQFQSSFVESPPIASSTFWNGNDTEVSPVSFTFRNDCHDDTEYLKVVSEESKVEGEEMVNMDGDNVKNGSSNSNLSCTFRNDSQMHATRAEEDLPGYSVIFDNPRLTGEMIRRMDTSSEEESPIETVVTAVIEHDVARASPAVDDMESDQDDVERYRDQANDERDTDEREEVQTRRMVVNEIPEDVPRETMQYERSYFIETPTSATQDEALTLTNVTELDEADDDNGFADMTEIPNRSRWVNKDVFMFQLDRARTPGPGKMSEGYNKIQTWTSAKGTIDETGDGRKPNPVVKHASSTDVNTEVNYLTKADIWSKKKKRLSRSLTHLTKQLPEACYGGERQIELKSFSCANSLDGDVRSLINENARYHFLHDKGMIKISSPSLKLMPSHGFPAKQNPGKRWNDIDEESDIAESENSGISGVYVDNEFSIKGHNVAGSSEFGSRKTKSELTGESDTTENIEFDGKVNQQELENEQLERFLKIVDENNKGWDENVLQWINERFHNHLDETDDGAELEQELSLIIQQEAANDVENGRTELSNEGQMNLSNPLEESMYYSMLNQSEDLRNVTECREIDVDEEIGPGLMDVVQNSNKEEIAEYLNSDRTVSERELKEAVSWALDGKHFEVAVLLLEDICKLIYASEEDCVDVFPAYEEGHRWEPMFVVFTRKERAGEWDSFMGFRVYKRRYDNVSPEAASVVNSDFVKNHMLSVEDFQRIRKAVSTIDLQKNHTKITVINACPCKSKENGKILEEGLCIVIHCLIKGFVPFSEEPFPEMIAGIPVDVREGYFRLGVARNVRKRVCEIEAASGDESYKTDSINSQNSGRKTESENQFDDQVLTGSSSLDISTTDSDDENLVQSGSDSSASDCGDRKGTRYSDGGQMAKMCIRNGRTAYIKDNTADKNCFKLEQNNAVKVDLKDRASNGENSLINLQRQSFDLLVANGDAMMVNEAENTNQISDHIMEKVLVLILLVLSVCFQFL